MSADKLYRDPSLKREKSEPLEKEIERAVCEYAKKKGVLAYKFTSPAKRSVPDRLFLPPNGPAFFVEFKRRGQKPTDGQRTEIEKIRKQGTSVFVVDNVASGKRVIDEMLQGLEKARHAAPVEREITMDDF